MCCELINDNWIQFECCVWSDRKWWELWLIGECVFQLVLVVVYKFSVDNFFFYFFKRSKKFRFLCEII